MKMKTKLASMVAAAALFGIYGCNGSDGANGAAGTPGSSAYEIAVANGFTGTEADWIASLNPNSPQNLAAAVNAEQCGVCHSGFARDGASHQAIYDDYVDTTLGATITGVTTTGSGPYTVVMAFTITKNGVGYEDADGLPSFQQKRFYIAGYDSSASYPTGYPFPQAQNIGFTVSSSTLISLGNGDYTITKTGQATAPSANSFAYLYLGQGSLDVGSSYSVYSDVVNSGLNSGNANTYVSTANVSACEKCHGAPYRKHGYRMAEVSNLSDFAACKACHYDDGSGGHMDWQLLVDDPATYAAYQALGGSISSHFTSQQTALYTYKRTVMADTHMSHAMEFAYPQSMGNCVTCHEGHLTEITAQSKFVAGTCKTCHPVTGVGGTDPKRAPALADLWAAGSVPSAHAGLDMSNNALDCTGCHNGGIARTFAELHNGYDRLIYEEDGTRFSSAITTTIGTATLAGNVLTIPFTINGSTANHDSVDAVPTVMVSFYGYDTKDYVVSNHTRDGNNLRMEFALGSADNAMFTTVDGDGSDHTWSVALDFGAYAATPTIPEMIASGVIRRAEIAIMPGLLHATLGTKLGLDAPSVTFDLTTGLADPTYYPAIVDVAKCNNCHDQLATTFHSGDRGGNVVVCRMCHVTTSGGSHLELQSRSIDSYVHAIHSFQLFDPGDIDFTDPVEALHASHHLASTFPNFTMLNCEACHVDATSTRVPYDMPSQAMSMPGVYSATDTVAGRSFGNLAAGVTGPGARACSGCHRATLINEDDAGGLAAFMQHTKANGYDVPSETGIFSLVLFKIMASFY